MNATPKRQKVASACERCRKRKLGCDRERPCQLCVRAGAECVPRNLGAADSASSSTAKRPETDAEPSSVYSIPSNDTASKTGSGDELVMPDSSIVDLTALVLSKMSLGSSLNQDTSALPGGNKVIGPEQLGRPHWRQIVALQLPDNLVLGQLVDKFFLSVDWFIMVFHEQLFRERFVKLLGSSHVEYHEENFLWLCMLVVALGAQYTSISQAHTPSELDLRQLTTSIMMQIETRFLQFLGCATLEAVQISILMGSFLLSSGRPNIGLGISAAGVKIAQVINLHRENLWSDCSAAERETRRRTWWALEVFDKYTAIAFGRPCIVDDSDCNVGMVSNIGAPSQGDEDLDTRLLFHKCKFRLYRIMGQFLGRRRRTDQTTTIRTIHDELTRWKEQLPSQLQTDSYTDAAPGQEPSIYQMQALALQLTYDNMHIILHRAAAFGQGSKTRTTTDGLYSLQQLIEAAMRTSSLHRFPNSLRGLRSTHASMHIGITLFTAGIVLCLVSLSQPLSGASQRAKSGVMHLIRACEVSSNPRNAASQQSIAVLERLVAVILQHESKLITGRVPASAQVADGTRYDSMPVRSSILENTPNFLSPGSAQVNQEPATELPQSVVDDAFTSAAVPELSTGESLQGLNFDASLSVLMDFDLTDASQMWLWAQNQDFNTYP